MLTAKIREDECIGCSRCIDACPVDAIIGANKFTHTVLIDECIGCKLCLNPCPVDCIDILPLADVLSASVVSSDHIKAASINIDKAARAEKAKERFKARNIRLQRAAQQLLPNYSSEAERKEILKNNLDAALLRIKDKLNSQKVSKNLFDQ